MRVVPLDEYATRTADATGSCVVAISPVAKQIWHITNLAVSSTSTDATEARAYVGAVSAQGYVAGTYDGNNDNAGISLQLRPGGVLSVAWSGATPGASCTVSVNGTMEVPQ